MKALSIKQPWLYCITNLDKRVENRTWKPPHNLIGQRIALHASKKLDEELYCIQASDIAGMKLSKRLLEMPMGAIVATAAILGWVDSSGVASSPSLLHRFHNKWFFGPVGWVLYDVERLVKPVPCRGALGLWDVPEDIYRMFERPNLSKSSAKP